MDKTILTRAIEAFGRRSQILKAIEEMAELTVALARVGTSEDINSNEIIEEIADVSIMVEQLALMVGARNVAIFVTQKMQRLEERIDIRREQS